MSEIDQCIRCGTDLLPAGTHGVCTPCAKLAPSEIAKLKDEIKQLRVKAIEVDIIRSQREPSRAVHRVHSGQHRVRPQYTPWSDDDNG